MKYLPKINMLITLLAVVALVGLTSCTKENPIYTDDPETFSYVSAGTTVEEIEVSEATLNTDIQILNEIQPQAFENGTLLGGKLPMFPFREILYKLNLTEEQKELLKAIMKEHTDCERAARIAYYQYVMSVIEKYNEQRKEIRAKVESGELSKKDAAKLLREIDWMIKKEIRESGALLELHKSLRDCTEMMITKIKGILTPEQLEIFNKWLNRKTGKGGTGSNLGTGTGNKP